MADPGNGAPPQASALAYHRGRGSSVFARLNRSSGGREQATPLFNASAAQRGLPCSISGRRKKTVSHHHAKPDVVVPVVGFVPQRWAR